MGTKSHMDRVERSRAAFARKVARFKALSPGEQRADLARLETAERDRERRVQHAQDRHAHELAHSPPPPSSPSSDQPAKKEVR